MTIIARPAAWLVSALLIAGSAGSAIAQSGLEESVAVIELYIGEKDFPKTPEYVNRIFENLRTVAPQYAMLKRSDARKLLRGKVSSAAKTPTAKIADLQARLKAAEDLVFSKPKKAVPVVEAIAKEIDALVESSSINEDLRNLYFDAQMKLARANNDLGNSNELDAALQNVLVFLGEAKITEDNYHPFVVEAWKKLQKKMKKNRSGTLLVKSQPRGAKVILNGKAVSGETPATIKSLYPGVYSVQAQMGSRVSGPRRVTVEDGGSAEVEIELDYETALNFGDHQFGLRFANRGNFTDRAGEFAARIGRLLDVDKIVLAGLTETDGKAYIEGYLINVSSKKVVLSDALYTKANVVSRNRVKQLATYLGKGKKTIIQNKPWYEIWLGWVGVGLAIGGGVTGGVLWSEYESLLTRIYCVDPPPACEDETQRALLAADAKVFRGVAVAGFIVAGVGLIGSVLAFTLIKEEVVVETNDAASGGLPRLQALTPLIQPETGTAGVGATFTF